LRRQRIIAAEPDAWEGLAVLCDAKAG